MTQPLNKYHWREQGDITPGAVRRLAEAYDIPSAGARFLVSRSFDTPDAAQGYLFPEDIPPVEPHGFENMQQAVSCIEEAAREKKRVLIHGDYDVDGICGTALLYQYLHGGMPHVYRFLPDRRKDGYGLAERAVDWSIENHIGLVIAVDCGTSDGPLVSRLLSRGIDVIICDHHEFPADGDVPGILLNPVRPEEPYPFKGLCGAGVAFKLVEALADAGFQGGAAPSELLDLVALATVADVAPLIGENRRYVRMGLRRINTEMRAGIDALKASAFLDAPEITAYHLGFIMGPRLNAPGRISSPKPSLEILCATNATEAAKLASTLETLNNQRKDFTELVMNEVMRRIHRMENVEEQAGFVFEGKDWDEGVLGIAASRVAEDFGKPTLLISVGEEFAKGSGRGVRGVHLKEQMDRCAKYLVRYGGHAQAVGFSMAPSQIDAFRAAFLTQVKEATRDLPAKPVLDIDSPLSIDECSVELLDFLNRCEPFGHGNKAPVWVLPQVTVLPETRWVGSGHVKFHVEDSAGRKAEAIYFRWGHADGPEALRGRRVDLAVRVRKGYYLERTYPEIQILDVRGQGGAA